MNNLRTTCIQGQIGSFPVQPCLNCGEVHDRKNYLAFGKKCRKYSKMNHFAKVCLSKEKATRTRQMHMVEIEDDIIDSEFFVGTVEPDYNVNTIQQDKSE